MKVSPKRRRVARVLWAGADESVLVFLQRAGHTGHSGEGNENRWRCCVDWDPGGELMVGLGSWRCRYWPEQARD